MRRLRAAPPCAGLPRASLPASGAGRSGPLVSPFAAMSGAALPPAPTEAGGHAQRLRHTMPAWKQVRAGGGCTYQPKLNQNQRKRAEHRQRR